MTQYSLLVFPFFRVRYVVTASRTIGNCCFCQSLTLCLASSVLRANLQNEHKQWPIALSVPYRRFVSINCLVHIVRTTMGGPYHPCSVPPGCSYCRRRLILGGKSNSKFISFEKFGKKWKFTSKAKFWNFEAESFDTGKIATGKLWWVLNDFAIFLPNHIFPGR